MPGGLVALLDDIAAIAKMAAASLDDVAAATAKAGAKAAGVVIDDTAVTPTYVTGFTPDRELPIIGKIALGSLRNKLLILLPAALVLSAFAPWAITPLLLVGGAYLCFEAAEKIWEKLAGHHAEDALADVPDAAALEARQVAGAIRTDLILSAEIMAIALGELDGQPLLTEAMVLALVAVAITVAVYGVVALIVKMDDIGLKLARRRTSGVRALGRGLVQAMPAVLRALSVIGTAAMLWVGGGIVLHALEGLGWGAPAHLLHGWAHAAEHALPLGGAVDWSVYALGSGLAGIAIGAVIVALLHLLPRRHAAPSH